MRWQVTFILAWLFISASFALADHDRSRCVVIVGGGNRPVVVTSSTTLFGLGGVPAVVTTTPFIASCPVIVTQPFVTTPVFVTPSFICAQFTTGNFSLLWCQPLQTSFVIVGPFGFPSAMFIDRTAPFSDRATAFGRAGTTLVGPGLFLDRTAPSSDRATAFGRAGTTIVLDPSATFGTPQIWHNPLLQPGMQVFQLRYRSADEVAQALNASRILPDGQFVGIGNLLLATAPSLAVSGVQQSRLRDLIAALDQPTAKPSSGSSEVSFRVELFRAHSATCACQETLPSDKSTLLRTIGYPCGHRLGEANWRPATQDALSLKADTAEVTLKAKQDGDHWLLTLEGKLGDQSVKQEGKVPIGKQPIVLIAPTTGSKEALIALLTPQ
ncbi:MAG: hypothetical protein PVTTEEND_001431 [Candidatus Fervidibacter sp.]